MKILVCLFALCLCSQASAQALTERESIVVSNLTGLRLSEKHCSDRYVFDKDKRRILVEKLGVNIDGPKYRAELKKQTKTIEGYFKEIGPRLCDKMYDQIGGQRMGSVMMKR